MAVRSISVALAFALLVGSHRAAYAEGPRAPSPQWLERDAQRRAARAEQRPTFPFSRFFSTALFVPRFVGARGLLGRIRTGEMSGFDVRSVRRLLMAKHEMSGEQAMLAAEKIKRLSDASHFFDEGKQYTFSRFLGSRVFWGTYGFLTGLLAGLGSGSLTTFGSIMTGVTQGTTYLGAAWAMRAVATRGLAGRIILGKGLFESEERLLSTIARGLEYPEVAPMPAAPDNALPVGGTPAPGAAPALATP